MLDKHSHQIRLFELLPGAEDDMLRGRLRVVNLDADLKYDALSYVWGNPQPRFTLALEGDEFLAIPENLRNALINLRLKRRSRFLWIDAICINQQDLQERSHQVMIMREIFSRARMVRVWLDTDVDPRSEAFKMALRLEGPSTNGLFATSNNREARRKVALGDFGPDFWKPLRQILENPYWERVWTQQEYLLAKNLRFHLPRGTLTPEPMIRFDSAISRSIMDVTHDKPLLPIAYLGKAVTRLFNSLYTGFRTIRPVNIKRPAPERAMLIELFLNSRDLKATDPRDRVYGFMGLATDCGENDVKPKYDVSPLVVYQQVMEHYVRTYRSINFLCAEGHGHDHFLPSWLPSPTKSSSLVGGFEPEYTADIPPTLNPHLVKFHSWELFAQGIKCDSIISRGMPHLCFQPILQWSKSLEQMLNPEVNCSKWTEDESVLNLLGSWSRDGIYPCVFNRPKRTLAELGQSLSNLLKFARRHPRSTLDDLARNGAPTEHHFSADLFQLVRLLRLTLHFGTFVWTEGNRLGLCHPSCGLPGCQPNPGDEVWILYGCRLPMILRPEPHCELYSVIGCAVFPGLIAEACADLLPDGSPGPTYKGQPPEIISLVLKIGLEDA